MASGELASFKKFISSLHTDIVRNYGTSGARLARVPSFQTRPTGGWSTALLSGAGGLRLEVWYDKLIPAPYRSLWVGLYCQSNQVLRKYFSALSVDVKKNTLITGDDIKWLSANRAVYSGSLKHAEFERLYAETHSGLGTFVGRYFFGSLAVNERRFLSEVGTFLSVLLAGIGDRDDDPNVYPQLSGKEGRKIAVAHIRRERVAALAVAAKKRDDYECRVCHLRFAERYGPLGREFAEAHHIVPLSKSAVERVVKVKDLITVCANCHRMLHRLKGEKGDLVKLRSIFKELEHSE